MTGSFRPEPGAVMKSRRLRSRRSDLWASILSLVLMSVAVVLLYNENGRISDQNKKIASQEFTISQQTGEIADLSNKLGTSHQQLVDGCKRQVVRDIEANISNYADWTVDKFFLVATQHPLQAQTQREARLTQQFIQPIKQSVASKVWVPLTNCQTAVDIHGSKYKLPKPVPFNVRKPPNRAVYLDPDLFR